jgi:REP element-mobilizing transposase RayT
MSRKVQFAENEYYHIYNRGTNKMPIFIDSNDKKRFLELLYTTNSKETLRYSDLGKSAGRTWALDRGETLVDIGAYCLMPNHFHILIRVKDTKGTSLFLQRLLTSYSMYFNKKYNRNGSLFQGKSKSEWINNDPYLKYLFSYIHLNPVKLIHSDWKESGIREANIGLIKKYLLEYKESSLLDYLGDRPESVILSKEKFPEYFNTHKEVWNDLLNWLNYKKENAY